MNQKNREFVGENGETNPEGRTRFRVRSAVIPIINCQVSDCKAIALPVMKGDDSVEVRPAGWQFNIILIMCAKHTAIIIANAGNIHDERKKKPNDRTD